MLVCRGPGSSAEQSRAHKLEGSGGNTAEPGAITPLLTARISSVLCGLDRRSRRRGDHPIIPVVRRSCHCRKLSVRTAAARPASIRRTGSHAWRVITLPRPQSHASLVQRQQGWFGETPRGTCFGFSDLDAAAFASMPSPQVSARSRCACTCRRQVIARREGDIASDETSCETRGRERMLHHASWWPPPTRAASVASMNVIRVGGPMPEGKGPPDSAVQLVLVGRDPRFFPHARRMVAV